jgi:hypothetical protein
MLRVVFFIVFLSRLYPSTTVSQPPLARISPDIFTRTRMHAAAHFVILRADPPARAQVYRRAGPGAGNEQPHELTPLRIPDPFGLVKANKKAARRPPHLPPAAR